MLKLFDGFSKTANLFGQLFQLVLFMPKFWLDK